MRWSRVGGVGLGLLSLPLLLASAEPELPPELPPAGECKSKSGAPAVESKLLETGASSEIHDIPPEVPEDDNEGGIFGDDDDEDDDDEDDDEDDDDDEDGNADGPAAGAGAAKVQASSSSGRRHKKRHLGPPPKCDPLGDGATSSVNPTPPPGALRQILARDPLGE
jgi:hypothetical protein